MKKLIIFDCDGVLVDSELIANRIDVEAFCKLGYKITLEESIKRFTGLNSKKVNKIIFEESGIVLPENFSDQRQLEICRAFEEELEPLMLELLQTISYDNFDICVASSSNKERVTFSLELTNQIQYFNKENIFTAQQVQNGKPAPDLFLYSADILGYCPKDCMVIEDSEMGIQAALAANIDVIGFLGGGHAQFEWYQEKIKNYGIPIAYNTHELRNLILNK